MDKRAAKREELRNKIIVLAEKRIKKSGLSALRARDLADEAGCALGGLYNMFSDMDALILEVNARTLDRMSKVLSEVDEKSASDQLRQLAATYLEFARDNPKLWHALFDHYPPDHYTLPDWYATRLTTLLGLIGKAIQRLLPGLSPADYMLRARTLFAAVHGVVSISLDKRFIGLADADLEKELQRFLGLLITGATLKPST